MRRLTLDPPLKWGNFSADITKLTYQSPAMPISFNDVILERFEVMCRHHGPPPSKVYNHLFDFAVRRTYERDPRLALTLLEHRIQNGDPPPMLWFEALARYLPIDEPGHMERVYRLCKQVLERPSLDVYKGVIRRAAKADKPELALEAFQEMVQFGIQPEHTVYSFVIVAKRHDRQFVDICLEEMAKLGFKPMANAYYAIIQEAADRFSMSRASHFFDLMKSAGFEADEYTISRLVWSCYRLGLWNKVLEYVDEFPKTSAPPTRLLIFASTACGMLERFTVALRYLERAKAAKRANIAMYRAVITTLVRGRLFKQALEVLEDAVSQGSVEVRTFQLFIDNVLAADSLPAEQAASLLRELAALETRYPNRVNNPFREGPQPRRTSVQVEKDEDAEQEMEKWSAETKSRQQQMGDDGESEEGQAKAQVASIAANR
jgi:pentatricopeptide repeat protein